MYLLLSQSLSLDRVFHCPTLDQNSINACFKNFVSLKLDKKLFLLKQFQWPQSFELIDGYMIILKTENKVFSIYTIC